MKQAEKNTERVCRQIEKRVEQYCLQHRFFLPREDGKPHKIALAVSGGADSMALLGIFEELAKCLPLELTVCHVNHGLRGESAKRDECFVVAECRRRGLPFRVFRAEEMGQIPAHVGEDWARELRYRCFAVLLEEGIEQIATAHTVTDQAETLLFRLARGTGLHGAGGIRPKRGAFVRPLLCLTREETEAYCRFSGSSWMTDETNLLDLYARNRIRHQVVPELETVNQGAAQNLARFCEKAAEAEAYLQRKADGLLEAARQTAAEREGQMSSPVRYAFAEGRTVLARKQLCEEEDLILDRLLHGWVARIRDPEERYIRLLRECVLQGSGAVQISQFVRICVNESFVWQETAEQRTRAKETPEVLFCWEESEICFSSLGKKLMIAEKGNSFSEKIQRVHKKDLKNEADYDKMKMSYPRLFIRTRREGDWFRPAGRGLRKTLRKLFNEASVPPQERETRLVLAEGSEVVWLEGFGFAEGVQPTLQSEAVIEIQVENCEGDVQQ